MNALRALSIIGALAAALSAEAQVTKYVRYAHDGTASYGVVEGNQIRQLDGAPFLGGRPTGKTTQLAGAELLAPAEPGKVIAIGFNYGSHLGDTERAPHPGVFIKLPSSIVGPDAEIIYPEDASNVHFEGELVLVIGKKASRVSKEDAADYIFGITAGNDVSERDWQRATSRCGCRRYKGLE